MRDNARDNASTSSRSLDQTIGQTGASTDEYIAARPETSTPKLGQSEVAIIMQKLEAIGDGVNDLGKSYKDLSKKIDSNKGNWWKRGFNSPNFFASLFVTAVAFIAYVINWWSNNTKH